MELLKTRKFVWNENREVERNQYRALPLSMSPLFTSIHFLLPGSEISPPFYEYILTITAVTIIGFNAAKSLERKVHGLR